MDESPEVQSCPRDTDGDGNCGMPGCQICSPQPPLRHAFPQQNLDDTPVVQRRVDEF